MTSPRKSAESTGAQRASTPTVEQLQRRVRVASGEEPGDLLLSGGHVVNVFTGQVEPADVVVCDGCIAGVGAYVWEAHKRIDVLGQLVLPGLIDAHMHIESTLLMPAELARLIVPRGTTAVVADPHEIGNVLGVDGIKMLLEDGHGLPLDTFFMAPSCVPATSWEHNGARLSAADIERLLARERVLGLAEVMDFPAVLAGQPEVLEKLAAALGRGAPADGHAPGLVGRDLIAYVAAGIRSDHESTTVEEALQKAALGMLVQVREGSSARNLDTLLPLIREGRLGEWCLATDDIHPDDLTQHGHLDALLRRVVESGIPLAEAVRHATLVPARHYGLRDRGAVAPGYLADLVVMSDPAGLQPRLVVADGEVVAREGRYLPETSHQATEFENTVRLGPLNEASFELHLTERICPVIRVVENEIVTKAESAEVRVKDGRWEFDPAIDAALVACIERHNATGGVGLGLVAGFGLQRHGALGSSVAHDSHNLIVLGTNPRDMLACARELEKTGGGFVVAAEGRVKSTLPLPVAGLLSTASAEHVCEQLVALRAAARDLGCRLPQPFGALSFLALPVIPELRVTDQGLFDVTRQMFVSL